MAESKVENLGRALTSLGIADSFLKNGELAKIRSVADRATVANDIISEKLKRGDWQDVVMMIYGGVGKADALYDGDKDQLNQEILESAVRTHREGKYIDSEILNTLKEDGQEDLLFDLGKSLPLNYGKYLDFCQGIFEYEKVMSEKGREYHQIAGKKAWEDGHVEIRKAINHFEAIGDKDSLEQIFNEEIESGKDTFGDARGNLETIALSDSEKKDERLLKMVKSAFKKKGALNYREAFSVWKKHNVKLDKRSKNNLYEGVVRACDNWDIRNRIDDPDDELKLMWAKSKFEVNPEDAYQIFLEQEYEGPEVDEAILIGLQRRREVMSRRVAFSPGDVKKDHLERIYEGAPFDVRRQIAVHQEDEEKLQSLSREAKEKGEVDDAYRLWVAGKGDLENEYVTDLREKLLEENIAQDYYFGVFKEDVPGKRQSYDIFMGIEGDGKRKAVGASYEIARELNDEEKTARAREIMVEIDSRWALREFLEESTHNGRKVDSIGVDYVLGVIADEQDVEKDTLSKYVQKYLK